MSGGVVFEGMSLGVALPSFRTEGRGEPILRFMREARDPTLPTVLLEDSAALLSILVAAAGLSLAQLTRRPQWGAAPSAPIRLILIAVATFLAYENYSLLLGGPAPAQPGHQIPERLAPAPAPR